MLMKKKTSNFGKINSKIININKLNIKYGTLGMRANLKI